MRCLALGSLCGRPWGGRVTASAPCGGFYNAGVKELSGNIGESARVSGRDSGAAAQWARNPAEQQTLPGRWRGKFCPVILKLRRLYFNARMYWMSEKIFSLLMPRIS